MLRSLVPIPPFSILVSTKKSNPKYLVHMFTDVLREVIYVKMSILTRHVHLQPTMTGSGHRCAQRFPGRCHGGVAAEKDGKPIEINHENVGYTVNVPWFVPCKD